MKQTRERKITKEKYAPKIEEEEPPPKKNQIGAIRKTKE